MYDYELRIFNRWGELVYISKDQHQGWDGTYKGRPVDVGTFVWWLTYKKVANGPAFILKGDVTVIR
jgi:gliding motility-associated-like protein